MNFQIKTPITAKWAINCRWSVLFLFISFSSQRTAYDLESIFEIFSVPSFFAAD